MSINNKRSYVEYTVVEPTTEFVITFDDYDVQSKDRITVTIDGVLAEEQGYTVMRKNEQVVTTTPAVAEGTVRLTRETDIDEPFHKFTAGALFSAKSVDENFQQVQHSQQEVRDAFVYTTDYVNTTLSSYDARIVEVEDSQDSSNQRLATEIQARKQGDLDSRRYAEDILGMGNIWDGISTRSVIDVVTGLTQADINAAQKLDTGIIATAKFGGVERTQAEKNSDTVSIKDFGAIGDGIADDSDAIEKASLSGEVVEWVDGIYNVTRRISAKVDNSQIVWRGGSKATLVYTGAEHTERLFLLSGEATFFDLDCNLKIDGNLKVNKCLEITNNIATMQKDRLSRVRLGTMQIVNAKRVRPFGGGDAVLVRGSFSSVLAHKGFSIDNCILGTGAGNSGSVGISGMTVSQYSYDSYAKSFIVDDVEIGRVYSEDDAYTMDMDAIRYLVSKNTATGDIDDGFFYATNLRTLDASGRSVKTQCKYTNIKKSTFERTGALSTSKGNNEIDSQYGHLVASDCMFKYSNGSDPTACINASSDSGITFTGFTVKDCNVMLDSSSVLTRFLSTYPREGMMGFCDIDNVRISGKVITPVLYRVNGEGNTLRINKMHVTEILGRPDESPVLVSVWGIGAITPKIADVYINDCSTLVTTNDNYLLQHKVVGNVALARLSASNNIGFIDDYTSNLNASAINSVQVSRAGRIGSKANTSTSSGFMEVLPQFYLDGSSTEIVDIKTNKGAMVFLTSDVNQYGYASFYVHSTSSGGSSQTMNVSPYFKVGNTTEPILVEDDATVKYVVWFPTKDKMHIKNISTVRNTFTAFVMCPA